MIVCQNIAVRGQHDAGACGSSTGNTGGNGNHAGNHFFIDIWKTQGLTGALGNGQHRAAVQHRGGIRRWRRIGRENRIRLCGG